MPKLSDVKLGDVLHTILKGENGTGKSIAAVSYAASGPLYVFDFEDRMRSVANYYRRINRLDVLNNVEFDTYFSFSKVRKKFEALESNPRGIKNVLLDSLTSFCDRALSNTKEFKKDSQEESGKVAGKTIGEFRVNTMEDFNAEAAAIQEFIVEHAMILKSMKINFILTGHVIKVHENDEERGSHIARYLMSGAKKAGQKVPGYYDEMYHTNVEPGMGTGDPPKYTARTRHTGNDTAKTSLTLPPKIDFTDKVFYEELMRYVPKPEPVNFAAGELIIPPVVPPKPGMNA